jgi:hypothetical protein
VHFVPGKLDKSCYGPIGNELDGDEEVLFLSAQLKKAINLQKPNDAQRRKTLPG